jgi:hypothetical protein
MNISGYFLLFLILLSNFQVSAQETDVSDTIEKPISPDPFIRVGFDLSAIGRNIYEKEVQQFEFSLDSEVRHNIFANIEGGILKVLANDELSNYSSNGRFFRVGADYNLIKRQEKTKNDVVLVGLRYSWSHLTHESSKFTINNPYWGDHIGTVDSSPFSIHWFELAGSIKTEIFRNLYFSWTLRTRIKLSQTKDPILQPYYIGGFGKGTRNTPVMIHYSIAYRFGL